jgi:hypothetical protein
MNFCLWRANTYKRVEQATTFDQQMRQT